MEKILLIDDEPILLDTLQRYLVKRHYHVEAASNALKGWELFSQTPENFDVIITDLKMPKMNGVELFKRIRETGYTTPVIFMTGHMDEMGAQEISQMEIYGLLSKPFKLSLLKDMLTTL